jgi:hypothetical protein
LTPQVVWAIGVLASDGESETHLVEVGAIEFLMLATKAHSEKVQKRALWSIGMISQDCWRDDGPKRVYSATDIKYLDLILQQEPT